MIRNFKSKKEKCKTFLRYLVKYLIDDYLYSSETSSSHLARNSNREVKQADGRRCWRTRPGLDRQEKNHDSHRLRNRRIPVPPDAERLRHQHI
jgi:hypothetical protein